MRAARHALALATWALLTAGAAQAQLERLSQIPTETQGTVADGAPARVRITSNDAPQLERVLGIDAPINDSSFEYTISVYPQIAVAEERTWLEPTFIVDFEEPVFKDLDAQLARLGEKPDRAAIVDLVDELMDANAEKDWSLASQVAAHRTGDCSEHALLTTALLRRLGRPARMAVGAAVLSDGHGHYHASGHAWTETLEDGKWVIADAALNRPRHPVRYVPIGIVADEGMGYTLQYAALLRAAISKVVVLGPAD